MRLRPWNVVLLTFTVAWGGANTTQHVAVNANVNDPSFSSSVRLRVSERLHINHNRPLKTGNAGYDTNEQRGFSGPIEKAKAALMADISADTITRWVANGKSAGKAFDRFHLTKVDDLFDNPQFFKWVNYVDDMSAKHPEKATTTIPALTARYGDEGLLKMLEAAEKVPKTKDVATKLLGEQVQHWVAIGKSPDDVFKLYKLKNVEGNLLDSPQFLKWLQYVDDLKAKHPEKATTTIPTLTARYKDEGLLKMLEAAEKIPSTKDVASKLLGEQVQHWAATGKSPDDVFMLYKMNTAADKVFENARWKSWVNYVKLYNEKNPKSQTSVVASLSKLYGDAYLVNMLAAAGKVSTTKSTSKKMEFELINLWLKNDQSTDDVFKLLDLDKAADKVLGSPQLEVWGKYAGYINKNNPDNKVSLIATLSTHYKDEGVVKMLEAAKKVPATEAVAMRLQTEQLHHWLSIDRAPANVFTLFKLDKAGENLLSNPQFLIWRKYADDFGLKNPKTTETTIGVLRMNYEDDVLANLIISGMKSPSTKPTATRLQSELFKSWMPIDTSPPVPPETVFQILKLANMAEKAFASPMFAFWKKYMEHYNKVILQPDYKKRATVISALMANYDDKRELVLVLDKVEKASSIEVSLLGKNLKTELLNQLLLKNEGPSDVAKVLSVKSKADANWNLYEKYTKDYYGLVKLRKELELKPVW